MPRGKRPGHVERVPPVETMACPHCTSLGSWRLTNHSCCVCAGARTVTLQVGIIAGSNAWAREGCSCGVCVALAGPVAQLETARASSSPFAQGFARRAAAGGRR
jgi:hypothetical protein